MLPIYPVSQCLKLPLLAAGDWQRVSMYTCMSDLLALLDEDKTSNTTLNPTTVIKRLQYGQEE